MNAQAQPVLVNSDSLRPGDVVGGRYRIGKPIGRGGMGSVYEARHTVTSRDVALKYLVPPNAPNSRVDSAARTRFLREARAAATVRHPALVDVLDAGEHDGAMYLVMERLHGIPFSEVLRDDSPLAEADAIQYIMPVLSGLASVHRAGVIHRDLKPSNLFVCTGTPISSPHMKILDFGIAKLQKDSWPSNGLPETAPGEIVGTLYYMSPEQLDGATSIDHRTDLYSIGAVLYEAVTGQGPSCRATSPLLIRQILIGARRPLSDAAPQTSPRFREIVNRLLSVDPKDRFADARELMHALDPSLAHPKFSAGNGLPHRRPAARSLRGYRRTTVTLAICAGLLASVLGGAVASYARSAHKPNSLRNLDALVHVPLDAGDEPGHWPVE